ncbi:hypothetical protein PVAP13_4KG110930 [Panicum virgatum]|uniref:Uncharacterized protein n=1 Tax=Panicum virgatum TaxID=38727 RepID=A0A8T0TJN4_PANVG|nr:hypothetical protein PVAP13_4KG110930 [Panicum virgatum]
MQDGSSRRGREGTPSLPAREGRGRQRAGSTSTPAGPTPRVAFGSRLTHWAPAARANAHVPAPRPGSRAAPARTGRHAGCRWSSTPLRSVAVRALRITVIALSSPRRGPLPPAAGDGGGGVAPGHRS